MPSAWDDSRLAAVSILSWPCATAAVGRLLPTGRGLRTGAFDPLPSVVDGRCRATRFGNSLGEKSSLDAVQHHITCDIKARGDSIIWGKQTTDACLGVLRPIKDVWHFRLELFTGNPSEVGKQVVLFDQSWDGPEMSEQDNPLFHPWHYQFSISPGINLGQVYARATSCC